MKVIDGGFGKTDEEGVEIPDNLQEHLDSIKEILGEEPIKASQVAVVAVTNLGILVVGCPSAAADISYLLTKAQMALVASGE